MFLLLYFQTEFGAAANGESGTIGGYVFQGFRPAEQRPKLNVRKEFRKKPSHFSQLMQNAAWIAAPAAKWGLQGTNKFNCKREKCQFRTYGAPHVLFFCCKSNVISRTRSPAAQTAQRAVL